MTVYIQVTAADFPAIVAGATALGNTVDGAILTRGERTRKAATLDEIRAEARENARLARDIVADDAERAIEAAGREADESQARAARVGAAVSGTEEEETEVPSMFL